MYVYTPPEKKYRNAKYILPYVIGFFFLICFLQIIGQFVTIDQLNKVSGKITNIQTKIISYGHKRYVGSRPNWALVITLDHGDEYNIEDIKTRAKLEQLLHVDDQITIYYPTLFYKVVCVGFAHSVNQVELGKQVVYSFDEQKQQAWLLVGMFAVMACVFWGMRYYMMNTYGPE